MENEILNSNEMEFMSEVVNQIVEERFGENGYTTNDDGDIVYTEEAQDFFNERYDELETLYLTLIKK